MISVVSGTILSVEAEGAVVDVNGLGLFVSLVSSHAVTLSAGDAVVLHTLFTKHQDDITLSGFPRREDLELFALLTDTPGVGAKTARAALATLGYDGLVDAIRRGNEPALRKVPGIGPRAAAMLLATLRPKLGADENSPVDEPANTHQRRTTASTAGEAIAALQALGWNKRDAIRAVEQASTVTGEAATVEALIRSALASLGPRR